MSSPLLRDRLTGRESNTPGPTLLLGRWQVADAEDGAAFLNSLPAQPGDFLVPDATGRWSLADTSGARIEGVFSRAQSLDELESASVGTLGARLDELVRRGGGWLDWIDVPPLVPGMSERLELQPLELATREKLGHLQQVCRRPRAHLRVDVERTSVSRARRIPSQAANFLAAHTEDWERPTLRAVVPRRILSLVRDDEFDIYENRVAARLVDHLVAYLNRRVAELRRLQRIFELAADYGNAAAGGSHWRQKRLFSLWGKLLDANEGRRKAERVLREIEFLRCEVAGLMDSSLYQEVPRRAAVSNTLTMTNILANDAHYRQVAALWLEWTRVEIDQVRSPRQVFKREQATCHAFAHFCVLLVVRGLEQLGVEPESLEEALVPDADLELKGVHGAITLRWSTKDETITIIPAGGTPLRLVPMPAVLDGLNEDEVAELTAASTSSAPDAPMLVILHPSPGALSTARGEFTPPARWSNALPSDGIGWNHSRLGFLPVSPWDIGSMERVTRTLRWVTSAPSFIKYPRTIVPPPTGSVDIKGSAAWLRLESSVVLTMRRPPLRHEIDALGIDQAVAAAEANVRELKAERERVAAELRDVHRRGDPTSEINARKKALTSKIADAEERFRAIDSFAQALNAAVAFSEGLLLCPTCGRKADPRNDFKGGPDHRFECTCSSCSTSWGTQTCGLCSKQHPTLLPAVHHWSGSLGTGGWVDQALGADVLAVPCRAAAATGETAFVCPWCGRCSCAACRSSSSVQ